MPNKILTKALGLAMMGQMRRQKGSYDKAVPVISPDIQGDRAYSLLSSEQKGQLKFCKKDAAKIHKCRECDLQWKFCKDGCLHIRPRPRIEVPIAV